MWQYILKRVLIFVPTMILITLLSFVISRNAPGDPVESLMGSDAGDGGQASARKASEQQYLQVRRDLFLDLPIFYFSLGTLAESDTLHRLPKPEDLAAAKRLINQYGNWPQIQNYLAAARELDFQVVYLPKDSVLSDQLIEFKSMARIVRTSFDEERIALNLGKMNALVKAHPAVFSSVSQLTARLDQAFLAMKTETSAWKGYVPVVHFYGANNQYHRWLMNLLTFDFGISYSDKRPIATKIGEAALWTFVINFISIVLTYLISIPLGVFSARNRYTAKDNVVTAILFMFYSLPNFWIATMLIIFLGGGEYLSLFPSNGVQDTYHSESWPFFDRLKDWAYHLILPVFCYTYAGVAFLSRQMRVGMLETLSQDYVRTARAKGLSENVVVWKHAIRNSLIPIITQFASIFPAMVGGSVILESIFSIPGMGFLSFKAVVFRDYPTIVAVFTISGFLTLIGILVADILYAVVDPRISFSKK